MVKLALTKGDEVIMRWFKFNVVTRTDATEIKKLSDTRTGAMIKVLEEYRNRSVDKIEFIGEEVFDGFAARDLTDDEFEIKEHVLHEWSKSGVTFRATVEQRPLYGLDESILFTSEVDGVTRSKQVNVHDLDASLEAYRKVEVSLEP